jgi:hypothetical protein
VREPKHRWLLTFFFGLVHGFGFASVLAEIGLLPSGVIRRSELQRRRRARPARGVRGGADPPVAGASRMYALITASVVLLVLSSFWFFERVLGRVWLRGWMG